MTTITEKRDQDRDKAVSDAEVEMGDINEEARKTQYKATEAARTDIEKGKKDTKLKQDKELKKDMMAAIYEANIELQNKAEQDKDN